MGKPILMCAGVLTLLTACSQPTPPPPPPPTVVVGTPLRQTVTSWDEYPGYFLSTESVEVRPRVSGAIESVNFVDGQHVDEGQLLFVVDPRPYQAQLARARADVEGARAALANADAELKRIKSLAKTQLASQAQQDLGIAAQLQAAAGLAAAQAAVTTAELNVSFTRVTAPMAGKVSYHRLAAGNLVVADNTLLTTIVAEDPIYFLFDAPESALLKYRRESDGLADARVEIRLQDETEFRWPGKIDFIDNQLNRSSGTIRGRAVVANPKAFISPGMYGRMRVYASPPAPALLVPDEAIVTDQTLQIVYVVNAENVVQRQVVQPGQLLEGLRVIDEGLIGGERVVISGVQRARPGLKVNVTEGTVSAFPSGVARGEMGTLSLPSAGSGATAP
ncbi:MAG: efflux RND transporter periplasmic adaptor subunit [Gammaproteobacteria bacterium]|nr:efflux RND transporter periplasmic adaptor subunit [Gammaproteobacteria bacterium]